MSQQRASNRINAKSSPRQVTPEKRGIRSQEKLALSPTHSIRAPTHAEMRAVFLMCRGNQWDSVLNSIRSNRLIATTKMTMGNNISTTIIHQAITSKSDVKKRARVIQEILDVSPLAATIKNGYGSLPLHVISQRNTKMNSKIKETLIRSMVQAYPESLVQHGGPASRTPLHIIFTDYISPALTSTMIHCGRQACFMLDKNGFLPIHVACSRHCSPEKLAMLLEANPASLFSKTADGRTILDLAREKATESHPNYALISEIERQIDMARGTGGQFNLPVIPQDLSSTIPLLHQATVDPLLIGQPLPAVTRTRKSKRKRKPVVKQEDFPVDDEPERCALRIKTEEKVDASVCDNLQNDSETANLLLHFSRHMQNVTSV